MGETGVKLHGMWASPFTMRARLALIIKGIEFEYIEEDVFNKSELLLQYNPVCKKVPVLVHNAQPIIESRIILEYIDETWTNPPNLLPKDPYQRARHRFWAAYFEPVFDMLRKTMITQGEEHETAVTELLEKLDVAEEGMKEVYPKGVPSFVQDVKPGCLDIVFYSVFRTLKVVEEFIGIKAVTPERYPLLVSWMNALEKVPEVQEVTPPKDKIMGFLQFLKQELTKKLTPKG